MRLFCISAFSRTGFTRHTKNTWKLAYLFLLLLPGNQVLYGQAIGSGQIQGTITDANGSVVSGATVEAVQQESGLHRTVTSSGDGGYNLPDLPVGPYQLNVTASGFSTYQQSGIVIQVGNNLRIDVKLSVGGVTQTVQVTAGASMVQTEDQSISQVIDRQRTIDLPLNGRQATQLILLTPGAQIAPSTDLVGSKNYPSSVALSVAGAQATNINYLMDGTDNNDAFTNVNLPFPFPDSTGAAGSCGALTPVPKAGTPCSASGNSTARRTLGLINPTMGTYYTQVTEAYTGLGSSYNGLLVSVQHRFSDYFTLLTNYTYSHCLSGPPENGDNAGDQFQDPNHPNLDYSNCASDLRHNFVTSAIIRSAVKGGSVKTLLLSGWQLAPIITATTGVPFTTTSGTDKSLTAVNNDRPNLIGNPYAKTSNRLQWLNPASFAFNTPGTYGNTRPYQFYGPHYTDVDGALSNSSPCTRRYSLRRVRSVSTA